jgi:CubicO group peptidase (beta-lactamase class C family)
MPLSSTQPTRRLPAIVIASVLAVTLILSPALTAQSLEQKIDQYCRAAQEVNRFHGAVLVARDGKVLLEKGYGWASAQFDVPNSAETKFLIGSITKSFTAVAILQLEERGMLTVNDPISKYITELPAEIGDKVTIHHLLSHTSGVHSYTDIVAVMARRTMPMTVEEIVGTFKDLPLDFEPGTNWSYSNSGYFLLGLIIERTSGQSYEDYLHEHLLTPAGMTSTGYAHNRKILKGMARGYTISPDGELVNALVVDMAWPYSAGALYSTVGDLYRWDRALRTDRLINKKSKEKMYTPVLQNYGYGWMTTTAHDREVIWHTGGIDGFSSIVQMFVDDDVCIVVLTNTDEGVSGRAASAIGAILFDKPYDVPVRKEPIASDPSTWADFVGVYEIDSGQYRVVTLEDGRLYSQRSGSGKIEIFPEMTDKFFFDHDNTVTLVFVRNDDGAVTEHTIHQQGEDSRAVKLPDDRAASVLAELFPVQTPVDASIYPDYVGEYELAPGFILTVRTRENRLFAQATGQGEFEIFPSSPEKYFLKVVDAQITFVRDDSGAVNSLILHQNGRDMPASRVK